MAVEQALNKPISPIVPSEIASTFFRVVSLLESVLVSLLESSIGGCAKVLAMFRVMA